MTLADWTDSEVVLVALALNSGAVVHIDGDQPKADRLNASLFALVQSELKTRAVHPPVLLRTLVGRAVSVLMKEEPPDAVR